LNIWGVEVVLGHGIKYGRVPRHLLLFSCRLNVVQFLTWHVIFQDVRVLANVGQGSIEDDECETSFYLGKLFCKLRQVQQLKLGLIFFLRDKQQGLPPMVEPVSIEVHDVNLVGLVSLLVLLNLHVFKHQGEVADLADQIVTSRVIH
jgi:hypothetical protein